MDDIERNVPIIFAALDNRKAKHKSHIVEVEGKINQQPIKILIDSRESHSYVDPKLVERYHLTRSKNNHSWMVQLATGRKRKISELVNNFPLNMNGLNTFVDLNFIHIGFYYILIRMDWFDTHHPNLDCYKKRFTCLDEEGK